MKHRTGVFCGGVYLAALHAAAFTGDNAIAQESPAVSSSGVEEVVVTARRRGAESVQDVAIAVTVFDADALRKSGISELSEVASRTPSFTFQEQVGNQQEIVIRGIGTLRLTGSAAEPSVGLFLDEVYIGRRGSATPPLFDLERVEVVRGPQGTLYGKNVVGGAINLITGKPTQEQSGRLALSFGQFDARGGQNIWGAEGYLTGGLSSSTAGRLAFQVRQHDGYSYNVLRNEELDDKESFALRGSLLIEPSDALTINLSADFGRDESNGQARHAVDDPTIPGLGTTLTAGLLSDNPRDTETPYDQYDERDVMGFSARFDYKLASDNTLTYLAAFRDGDYRGRFSLVGTASPPSLTDAACAQVEEYQGITQDLRLASSQGSKFNWVAGLYYLREKTKVIDNCIADSFLTFLGPGTIGDVLDGELLYDQTNVTTSVAAYGEVTWDIASTVALTVGGRFTKDEKDFRTRSECLSFGQPGFLLCVAPLGAEFWDVRTDDGWNEFTPKVGLDWNVSETALLYASAARGFKGGGWQGKPGSRAAALFAYDPETALTFELGAKTEWAGGRLRANVAAFYTDFEDLQVEQLDDTGLTLIIDNAADARINGIELELHAFPSDASRFWLTGSWIDSEYKDFIDSSGADLSGNNLARTPEFMFVAGGEYRARVGTGTLSFRAEYAWQDKMPWGVENTVYEDSYGLFDARVGFQPASQRWELALYGRNLSDELYRVDTIPFIGDVFSRFGPPRSYGLQFNVSF